MTKTVKEIVAEIKETLDKKGGLKHVYFVACGGSKAAIFPGLYLLQSEAKTFSATTYTSNEFVHATPKELDDRCVAVICSLKATAETVEAVKTGQLHAGASHHCHDRKYGYRNGERWASMWLPIPMETTRFTAIPTRPTSLRIGFELLHQFEGWDKYDKAMEAYKYIDEIVAEGKENCLGSRKGMGR